METKWSWVKGGLALGILNILIFLSGNHLGTTTAYAQTTGYLTQFFAPQLIPISTWTAGTCGGSGSLEVGWQWMLVLGVFLGGLLGKLLHSRKRVTKKDNVETESTIDNMDITFAANRNLSMPFMWEERFGNKPKLRMVHAFFGGILLLIGSRIAGGCTSSHIISGMSQMAVSGMLFGVSVFAAGIPTAILLYRKGRVK